MNKNCSDILKTVEDRIARDNMITRRSYCAKPAILSIVISISTIICWAMLDMANLHLSSRVKFLSFQVEEIQQVLQSICHS